MLEYYEAFTSLDKTIELTQNMIQKSSEEVNGTLELEWGEDKINLSSFRKANLADLVLEENKKLTKNDIEKMSGKDLLELFENTVEENLIQPTFVIGYPVEVSPLSRRNNDNPNIADRFELFIGGKEIANGFCELNDPDDQAERFKEQAKAKDTGDKEAMSFDEDYVIALEHGMPPAVGVGVGVDRLVMLLTNQTSIRDVLLFPQLKS
jgi:lysyl-tRNA synthetase class 2